MIDSIEEKDFVHYVSFTVTENSCRRLNSCSSMTESRAMDARSFGTVNGMVAFAFKSIDGSEEFSVN